MFPETLVELLIPTVLVGIFVSVFLSKLAWYQGQAPEVKQRVIGILTVVVTAGIAAFNIFVPEDARMQIGEYYVVIRPLLELLFGGSATMWTASQLWYDWRGKQLNVSPKQKAA